MFRPLNFLILSIVLALNPASAASEEVDLELVLAMDASGSISEQDYILQLEGTASAFLHEEIRAAIRSGPLGKIAVNIMLWSDAAFPKVSTGWVVLDDDFSIIAFANTIRGFQLGKDGKVLIGGGGTGIGSGIKEALRLIENNRYDGLRKTIDVSGDGIETEFEFTPRAELIPDARRLAQQAGVTINGLPILTETFPNLDDYYRDAVISGAGSFVVVAQDFSDFARAIQKKLWLEISSPIGRLDDNNDTVTQMAAADVETAAR